MPLPNRKHTTQEPAPYRTAEDFNLIIHDLLSPLTSLALSAELMQQQYDTGGREDVRFESCLRNVNDSVRRINAYVNMARIYINEEEVPSEMDVAEVIGHCSELLANKACNAGAQIKTHTVPIRFFGLQFPLYQIILNVLSNAIESFENCPREQRLVDIRLEPGSGTFSIVIQDNGCGIPQPFLSNAFDRGTSLKLPSCGSGYGLYSAKQAIGKIYGGTIEVESGTDQGTAVTITLPVRNGP